MQNLTSKVRVPDNEPVLFYAPGSAERETIQKQLKALMSTELDIPVVIDGREIRTGKTKRMVAPHHHAHTLGVYHEAGPKEIAAAIDGSRRAWRDWSRTAPDDRSAVFLKAADLLATKYRPILNAATMLGQSKTVHQAEIDSACEFIDFLRFNSVYQRELYAIQPGSSPGLWNRMEYRALEGFVFAVTPFNFTSIAGNLPTAPALMGNVSLWKPASTSVYSGYFIVKLLEEAGLPPGVIQFLPGSGAMIGDIALKDPGLAGIHFTGSTSVFHQMWKTVGENIRNFRSYPRIVGETGGKDFVFAHPSADVAALSTALVRGAFEYQGQKCSAASRAYIPRSIWTELKDRLIADLETIRVGDISDFSCYMGAVIDKNSFDNISGYLEHARKSSTAKIIAGGGCNDETGYFVEPTIIETSDPKYRSMAEEIFGPVLTVFVYEDAQLDETLELCDSTSPYALTGAIFAQDRTVIAQMSAALVNAAGNFYINTKPTGAVVNQQPFGGARASGTNDKAGSIFNLIRWVSMRTISETFAPPTDYRYPFLG